MLKVKCKRCALGEHRTRIVIGRGKTPADILMLGEAPGRAEDIIGEPFIGGSGKLLDLIIKKSYLHEYSIYFTNIVLCRAWDWRKSSNFILFFKRISAFKNSSNNLELHFTYVIPKVLNTR